MTKKFKYFFIFLFLLGCGYTPVYQIKKNSNIRIDTINFSNLAKIPTIISGGVSSIEEIINIKNNNYKNIEGVIIGKAIYDGNIDIKQLSKLI